MTNSISGMTSVARSADNIICLLQVCNVENKFIEYCIGLEENIITKVAINMTSNTDCIIYIPA